MNCERKLEAIEHRRNAERYRYLQGFLRDPEMRAILRNLLDEAEDRLSEIERDDVRRISEWGTSRR